MCLVGFSIKTELAAVAGSVALLTHCQARGSHMSRVEAFATGIKLESSDQSTL